MANKLIVGVNDLATVKPDATAWWDYEKNNGLTPQMARPGSQKFAWWKCEHGHSFDMRISDFTRRRSCPICAGRRVVAGINDLATVRPDLAAEWNYERNTDVTPQMVSRCSNKKAWWKCEHGHEWEAVINNRSRLGRNCPYCAGYLPIVGETDLATTHPDVLKYWSKNNKDILPTMVTASSLKKVLWVCEEGHEWEAPVASMTRITGKSHGCPYCSSQKILPGYNDLFTTAPELAAEWNYERNGNLTPAMIAKCSNKKVWWKCEHGHEWEETVNNRSRGTHGCPVCSGHKVLAGFNDLASQAPELAAQWNYERNGDLTPDKITARNDKVVWWTCNKGHEFHSSIGSRFRNNIRCPICSNKQVLLGYNDLATTHPEIAAQWCYEKNGKLTPQMVTYGSPRKVWWQCDKGHIWESIISNRTKGSGCPKCNIIHQSSFPEKALYYYLPYEDKQENVRPKVGKFGRRELDALVPSINTAFEYDGERWHKDTNRDLEKDLACDAEGIRLIRIRESGCPTYETNATIVIREDQTAASLNKAINDVLALLGVGADVDVERDKDEIQMLLK